MKKLVLSAIFFTFCLAPMTPLFSQPQERDRGEETADHPRIGVAINSLEDAIAYLEAAPHNFGGHKRAAIAASRKAIYELRKALAYREHREHRDRSAR